MFSTSSQEVIDAFSRAKNLNAALKGFLKREGRAGAALVSFAKSFRQAVATGRPAALQNYITQHFPAQEGFFMGVLRYAFPQQCEELLGGVIERYADEFNATYAKSEAGVTVTNPQRFGEIVRAVLASFDAGLQQAELPNSNFMRNALLAMVFEPDVLREVFAVLNTGVDSHEARA